MDHIIILDDFVLRKIISPKQFIYYISHMPNKIFATSDINSAHKFLTTSSAREVADSLSQIFHEDFEIVRIGGE